MVFLPKKDHSPLNYMQKILNHTKRYLTLQETRQFRVPLWPELSIARIWPQAKQLEHFILYMPDEWDTQPKKVERDFFWTILGSLQPDFVEHVIIDCREQREALKRARPPPVPKQLQIAPEWTQALLMHGFTSGK